jgi:hypothetical protein
MDMISGELNALSFLPGFHFTKYRLLLIVARVIVIVMKNHHGPAYSDLLNDRMNVL